MGGRVPRPVEIRYLRPPDHERVYRQRLVLDRPDVKVTLARSVELDTPLLIGGDVVLEPGADVVWFTFPGRWHDIGRFHLRDDTFTGLYADILTPARLSEAPNGGREVWSTTDLFLDVWMPASGGLAVLDADELRAAVERGWVSTRRAARAREEAATLRSAHEAGRWPPPVVDEWTLELARRRAEPTDGGTE